MEFDADKDGKLSKEELLKFAEDMRNHRPPEGGPRDGGRGPGGRQPNEGNRSGDSERSERPRRPE